VRALLQRCVATAGLFALTIAASAQPASPPSAVVDYLDLDRVAVAEGVVEAVRQSTLAAQVAGRVIALPVKAGDTVKAGQVLVQIDPRSAVQAEAASRSQVREAQANLTNAKAKYERSGQLYAQKFISQAALDQAEAEYLAAQAQSAAAIANAGQSATSKSFTTIVAPYDGVVASTDVEVGDMATTGRPLVTVFDPQELRVTATVPQSVLAHANLKAPIRIEVPSLERTLFAQKVTLIPVADTRTHTTQVRLDLPPAIGPNGTPPAGGGAAVAAPPREGARAAAPRGGPSGLMPGQYARALIVTGRTRALAIPLAAVLRRSEVTAVYVLDASGHAQLRQVRLGESAGDGLVEVVAGLSAGERVAIEPVRAGIEASRSGVGRS